MADQQTRAPRFGALQCQRIAREVYGLETTATPLAGYDSENHRLVSRDGQAYVLKISSADESRTALEAQMAAMRHLAANNETGEAICPQPCSTGAGVDVGSVVDAHGKVRHVQLLTWIRGEPLASVRAKEGALLLALGGFFGLLDRRLQGFSHPGAGRDSSWDLRNALDVAEHTDAIEDPAKRRIVDSLFLQHELCAARKLRRQRASVIHGDGNDHNVLVRRADAPVPRISGVIDFGDMVLSHPICELAIVAAYAILDRDDPIATAAQVARGFHEAFELTEDEVEILFHLICTRLCVSVTHAARAARCDPCNAYITISEAPAWRTLSLLVQTSHQAATDVFFEACGMSPAGRWREARKQTATLRRRHFPESLRLGFQEPIEMTRGVLQYMFDADGRTYLDAYNNVPHVGHCHPKVVRAAIEASALLNTNTRYLSQHRVEYVTRLLATMPDPLDVCVLVCSGSEANDLALRMARAHTSRDDVVVIDSAYHGITASSLQLSPYKWRDPNATGTPPPNVHVVETPNGYRGTHRGNDEATGRRYAADVKALLDDMTKRGEHVAAFFCEPLLGCAGQVVPPPGYLKEVFRHVRQAGGVCVADEVQVGFGRVGTHFWAFETHGVVPDIVTLGKSMGNGHPMAAVVTTQQIARSFDRLGLEIFSTYGGNTVSCAVGLAVLNVIEEEGLQQHANDVGEHLKAGLRELQQRHGIIGDVRGKGLFVGVELVRDQTTQEPAAAHATAVVERMKRAGVLCGTDGPLRNVIKLKPPLVFSKDNAERLVATLDRFLMELH